MQSTTFVVVKQGQTNWPSSSPLLINEALIAHKMINLLFCDFHTTLSHHNNLLSSRLTVVYERVPVVFQQQPGDNWRLLRCETPMIVSLGEYDKQKYTTASFTVLPTSTTQHSCAHSQL